MDILVHTPIWVWPLLALVIWLGVLQLKERAYSRWRVMVLPVVLVALSLSSTFASFGMRGDAFGAWAVGVLVAVGVNAAILKWPDGVAHDAASDSYRVPGSILPLLLILTIFVLRFIVGATLATAPGRAWDASFVIPVCGLLGLCTGLFLARAARILSTPVQRAPA